MRSKLIKLLFTVKYDVLLDGYFSIPLIRTELDDNWEYMTSDIDLNVDFYSYGADPRVSIGYDNYNVIAGVRVSVCNLYLLTYYQDHSYPR